MTSPFTFSPYGSSDDDNKKKDQPTAKPPVFGHTEEHPMRPKNENTSAGLPFSGIPFGNSGSQNNSDATEANRRVEQPNEVKGANNAPIPGHAPFMPFGNGGSQAPSHTDNVNDRRQPAWNQAGNDSPAVPTASNASATAHAPSFGPIRSSNITSQQRPESRNNAGQTSAIQSSPLFGIRPQSNSHQTAAGNETDRAASTVSASVAAGAHTGENGTKIRDLGGRKPNHVSTSTSSTQSRFRPPKKQEEPDDFLSTLEDESDSNADSDDLNVDWLDSGDEEEQPDYDDTGEYSESDSDKAERSTSKKSFNKNKMASDIQKGVSKARGSKQIDSGVKTSKGVPKMTMPAASTGLTEAQARKAFLAQYGHKKRIPFTVKDACVLDYLTRWSFATTEMMMKAGGFKDKMVRRLRYRFENYEEMGWVTIYDTFSGPVLWYPTTAGAELSTRPWLGGVSYGRINPVSQSHSLGLSSIASQLYNMSPGDGTPDILHMGDDWDVLAQELEDGDAWLISEREFRSPYSRIRKEIKGVIPDKYRFAMRNKYTEWLKKLSEGKSDLLSSPELEACWPDYRGEEMWMWIVWGNWIWNSQENNGEGDLIPIEDRMTTDPETGVRTVTMIKEYGDKYLTQDHNPDLVIARKRAADGSPRNIALELELTPKKADDYARIMAGYFSSDALMLYKKVIWLVPNVSVRRAIENGINKLYDYDSVKDLVEIIPFYTQERRNSFFSGADIVRGKWGPDGVKIIRDDGLEDRVDHRGGARVHPKRHKMSKD